MNSITNNPENKNHSLYTLLSDCIAASCGSSTSQKLAKALGVKGWPHEFIGWKNSRSIEELTWENESVYSQLVKIYS